MELDIMNGLEDRVSSGEGLSLEEALALTRAHGTMLVDLFSLANQARERSFGNRIEVCSIINARSGDCTENCSYCAQSRAHRTDVRVYGLASGDEMLELASTMDAHGATRFGIVTAGRKAPTDDDFQTILETVSRVSENTGLEVCASLGFVTQEQARALKDAGLTRFHHNLETSRSFFPNICTTHSYDEKLQCLRNIKGAGLKLCSGGIIGLGESWEQRVELAFEIKHAGADSVPINSLVPIKGTPLEGQDPIAPLDLLKTISIFRLIMPTRSISIAAGREPNLRDLQSMIFFAGANGMMIGNYLTLKGRNVKDDLQMISDLDLEIDNGSYDQNGRRGG